MKTTVITTSYWVIYAIWGSIRLETPTQCGTTPLHTKRLGHGHGIGALGIRHSDAPLGQDLSGAPPAPVPPEPPVPPVPVDAVDFSGGWGKTKKCGKIKR